MTLDVAALRTHFPALDSGIAFFDGPAGTQTPRQVGEAIAATLTGPLSNRGTRVPSEINATDAVTGFRSAYSDLLGVPPAGVVFGRSATQLTYDVARALAKTWRSGDELVVTRHDHDCNVRPWLTVAAERGLTVRWIDVDPASADLDWESVATAITSQTRLVAVTAASNVLGTKPRVRDIAEQAHAQGALVYVDGVHFAAHDLVDLAGLGADLFVCSPYKFLGPHCGVLAASPELLVTLRPDKLAPSPDQVPERFELGTLPYEIMAGAAAAVDFLASLAPQEADPGDRRGRLRSAWRAIDEHERRLRDRVVDELSYLGDRVVVHSRAQHTTPTLLMSFPGRSTHDAADWLAERDVAAPSGSFYAYETFARLGMAEALRIGIAPYVDDEDVTRLVEGLGQFLDGPSRDRRSG